jgi:hypothetical protein
LNGFFAVRFLPWCFFSVGHICFFDVGFFTVFFPWGGATLTMTLVIF